MHIKDSIVLITSAATMLGSALAERFAQLGAKVVLTDTHQQDLLATYARVRELSASTSYFFLQDYSPDSIEALLDFVVQKYQEGPDVLVNNWPNTPLPSVTDDHPLEQFTHNLTIMASTIFSFGQMSAEQMRRDKKEGVIVNIISNTDKDTVKGFENSASMVTGFTQSWAKELTPFNIRVGAVLPTLEATDEEALPMPVLLDELIRNTEYIVENEYFSGRTMSA
ncbi:SDR family oxidoreductase [Vibrio mangrovi]|uniref:Bile acid 7-dehydroxylase 1/3 n=1 Tax=Vibrio mangrovi TaxID=474394 RepID=A0A1Y6IU47_9VIBR|nr:SDR family oxidoreductase [Vibrio mangrovi]MDW6001437.1 SDR family oxidoreductase [Vibrio mangrovi]SMS00541.1 Bile acid 7-dehydroxylase 1/3 [Vibrio mangrovi]